MANLVEIGKSGIKVPFLGMGTWAIGGGSWWGDNDDELSVKTIQRAIDLLLSFRVILHSLCKLL